MATVEKIEHDRLTDDGNPHTESHTDAVPSAPLPAKPTPEQLADYDAETVKLILAAERLVGAAEAEWEGLKSAASTAKKQAEARTFELRQLIREREQNRGKRPEPTLFDNMPTEPPKWREVKIDDLDIPDGIKAHLSFETVKTAGELFDEVTSFNPSDGAPFGLPLGDVCIIREKLAEMADREAGANPAAAPNIPADLWREYPLERWTRFGLTAKDVEKMAGGEVKRESGRRPLATVGDLSDFSAPTSSGYSRKYADIKGIGTAGADRISDGEMQFWAWWKGGGEEEFAREKGYGNAALAGTGSGVDAAPAGSTDEDGEPADRDATDLYEASAQDDNPNERSEENSWGPDY